MPHAKSKFLAAHTNSVFAFSLILALLGSAVPADADLISHYKFEVDNLLADSVGSNHLNGFGIVNTTLGVSGTAMHVDAGSFAYTAGNFGLDGASARTLSLWFYQEPGNGDQFTVSWGGRTDDGTLFEHALVGGKSIAHLWGFGFDNLPDAPTYSEATWTHFAMTYDGATISIYQNGVHIPAADRALALDTTDAPLYIGGNNITPVFNDYTSSIDEVRIYDEALSAAQILVIYNAVSEPLTITEFTPDFDAGEADLTWNSRLDIVYAIDLSLDLEAGNWIDLNVNIPSQGTSTSSTVSIPDGEDKVFFRVREK